MTPLNLNQLWARCLCLLLVGSLLVNAAPAAPPLIAHRAGEIAADVSSPLSLFSTKLADGWTSASTALNWFGRPDGGTAPALAPQAQEEVTRIVIYPGAATIRRGERIFFAATGYDGADRPLSGVSFEWSSRRTGRDLPVVEGADDDSAMPLLNKIFEARAPGTFEVTATAPNGLSEPVVITVIDPAKNTETVSPTADDKQPDAGKGETPPITRLRAPGGWDDGDVGGSSNPTQQVGNAPGGPSDGGAHSGNFQIDVPVVSLPGRGIGVNLSLKYNARLWHKAGNVMTYDIDKGNPAPGWTLGYGKMVQTNSINGSCLIIDGDGTRHSFGGALAGSTVTSFGWTSTYTGHTTDGTFIDYSCTSTHYNSGNTTYVSGTAKLPDGTIITYEAANGAAEGFPTRIEDAQGNFITITYVGNHGPQIETITDTLNRTIRFYYTAGNLVSINGPQYGTGSEQWLVLFHYQTITLAPGFDSSLTVDTGATTRSVLDAIYFPGTRNGYWFQDAYSAYGMISKVQKRRRMAMDANGNIVDAGLVSFEAAYNYPLTADNSLTDAPTYTTRTDTWAGMTSAAPVTTYSHDNTANPRTSTVVRPDGVKTIQYAPGANQSAEGWVNKTEVYAAGATTPASITLATYVGGAAVAYQSPRVTSVQTTDERNQTMRTDFDYAGGQFNQVTTACQYGYAGEQLRCTRTGYENSANYIGQNGGSNHSGNHVLNLVKMAETVDPGGMRKSRVEFEYDGATLTDTPGVVNHDHIYV